MGLTIRGRPNDLNRLRYGAVSINRLTVGGGFVEEGKMTLPGLLRSEKSKNLLHRNMSK
jgi:hypothetical protein